MNPCALCGQKRCNVEQLRNNYLLCGTFWFYYRVNQEGTVIAFGTTNKSHPWGDLTRRRRVARTQ